MSARARQSRVARVVAAILLVTLGACASASPSPYDPPSAAEREPARAEQLSLQAAEEIPRDLAAAEALLREALGADLFHGPAHNNLGVVFLKQGKLYEAAQEFEWARKLMPGHPDPRVNLALVMESAGRTDEAIDAYAAALELRGEYLPAIQGLARLIVREGREDARLTAWLDLVALRSDSPEWRSWAARERAKRSSDQR